MQRYKILHRTYYNFPGYVVLGPHHLRLRPKEDHELRIESSTLNITPPATLMWHRDVEGNSVAIATFSQTTTQLMVESEVIIQQYNEAPLDFVVAQYAMEFPFAYLPDDEIMLAPYMSLPTHKIKKRVTAWVADVWHAGEPIQTYTLLKRLASYIHTSLQYKVREEPGVQSAEQTLAYGTGSCRDFALLFIEAARCMGLAARFVSGYLHAPQATAELGATHAWAEVYLPGAGWRGFDPTLGELAGAEHIAVAVARLAESVPPIEGSFVGPPGGSSMEVGVWVTRF